MSIFTDPKAFIANTGATKPALMAAAASVLIAFSVQAETRQQSPVAKTAATEDANAPFANQPAWLREFYEERNYRPLWTDTRRNRRRLRDYLEILSKAERYGLNPDIYRYSWLRTNLRPQTASDLRMLELEASKSLSSFARDIRDGQISPRIDMTDDDLSGREVVAGDLLARFAKRPKPKSFFAALRRDNPVQASLAKALKRYQEYARDGGWEPITLKADKLEVGSRGEDVIAVAKRLRAEEFFKGLIKTAPPEDGAATGKREPVYSEALADAVTAFQKSRGIEPDGIVGPETLKRLNEPVEDLISSIKLNMERARWLPQDFAERYVLVNIARYTVGMYSNERLEDEMRVVVGKYHQQTPVFAGTMQYAVVNPYWNVPASITRGEIAPKIAEDPSYLAAKNYEVVRGWGDNEEIIDASTVDWNDLSSTPGIRVRQKPGASNALGYVKFMFPNEYNVYLHDTPADSLFSETDRAFSHGCIRLEYPKRMASWVFKDAQSPSNIDRLIDKGERRMVSLDREIPVYITYFTAWAGPEGGAYFLPDVYNRDPRMAAAIEAVHQTPGGGPNTVIAQ